MLGRGDEVVVGDLLAFADRGLPPRAAELAAAGIPPADALGAATWRAREWLGRPGLEEGAPADLVLYPENPLADLGVLAAPSRVILRGRVVG